MTDTDSPSSSFNFEETLALAMGHHKAGRLQEAQCLYRDILQIKPSHSGVNHSLGVLAVQLNQPMMGLPYFKAALIANPGHGQYWLSYIDALIRAGKPDDARHVLVEGRSHGLRGDAVNTLESRLKMNTSLELSGGLDVHDSGGEWFAKGLELHQRGEFTKAEEYYSRVPSTSPVYHVALGYMGAVALTLRKYAEALNLLQQSLSLKSDSIQVLANLGLALKKLGRLDDAMDSYRRALEINQNDFIVLNNLANLLVDKGCLEEAEKIYCRALSIKPDDVSTLRNFGNVLTKLERHDDAEAVYRKALALSSSAIDPHNYYNQICYCKQDGDRERLSEGVKSFVDILEPPGIFVGDNLVTWGKNLSFLGRQRFMAAVEKNASHETDRSVIWRTYILCWAAGYGLRLEGDFVECGCYRGYSARVIVDYLDIGQNEWDKSFWIYDLFDHQKDDPHHALPSHGSALFTWVRKRFADRPKVQVVQGKVPEVLTGRSPEKIAFLHIDMNNVEAEIGALETLFDRVVPGALVVFDDYGWRGYRAQKMAEDEWLARRGYQVLELPTGQGLLIK